MLNEAPLSIKADAFRAFIMVTTTIRFSDNGDETSPIALQVSVKFTQLQLSKPEMSGLTLTSGSPWLAPIEIQLLSESGSCGLISISKISKFIVLSNGLVNTFVLVELSSNSKLHSPDLELSSLMAGHNFFPSGGHHKRNI